MKEKDSEQRWVDLCNAQGWNDYSQVLMLKGFVRSKGLMTEFAAYAQDCADEENAGGLNP